MKFTAWFRTTDGKQVLLSFDGRAGSSPWNFDEQRFIDAAAGYELANPNDTIRMNKIGRRLVEQAKTKCRHAAQGGQNRYQYRITANGSTGPVLDAYPGQWWAQIAEVCENRGGQAILERRLITTADILPLLADRSGWMELGAQVVSPWEILAQLDLAG
jgi:hypothetical protein